MSIMGNMFERDFENWHEGYTTVFEPEKRLIYLDRGMELEPGQASDFRRELFEYRYCNKSGKLTGGDNFLGLWLELKTQFRLSSQFLGKKKAERGIRKLADDFLLTKDFPDWKAEILREEYRHMILYYLFLCQNDRSYNSRFLGFIGMKDEALRDKLIEDLTTIAVETPKIAKMEHEYAPFSEIVNEIISQ